MNVAYATGSRADYGIVRRYLKLLNDKTDLGILVTGSHLEPVFGNSIKNIIDDGFKIDYQAPLSINNANTAGVIRSMSTALNSFGLYFEDNRYDLLIILGDRYEMLAVAIAAAMHRIPILHIHGGESSYGNYDEFIRHSITKMSTYHFVSTEMYRRRVIQLGENPNNVYNLGALGAENCLLFDDNNVDVKVKQLPHKEYYVIAFHPETLSSISIQNQVGEIIKALDTNTGFKYVFLGSNADTSASIISSTWQTFVAKHNNSIYFENLNNDSYLYLLKHSISLIGNSSSGIIEAPSLGIPSVNIGHRQDGRVYGPSVMNSECECNQILIAMKKALHYNANTIANPYYKPNAAYNYCEKTIDILNHPSSVIKSFYDIDFE